MESRQQIALLKAQLQMVNNRLEETEHAMANTIQQLTTRGKSIGILNEEVSQLAAFAHKYREEATRHCIASTDNSLTTLISLLASRLFMIVTALAAAAVLVALLVFLNRWTTGNRSNENTNNAVVPT